MNHKFNNETNKTEGGADQEKIEYKLVVLGNSGVGKTSLINKYVKDDFQDNPITTVGAMYIKKVLEIDRKTCQFNVSSKKAKKSKKQHFWIFQQKANFWG